MTADRSVDDVWAEIQAKCDEIRANDAAVLTLGEEVPNFVQAVSESWIERRSDRARGTEGRSRIYKSEVEKIWRRLAETGEARESSLNAPRFAWALIGRLIDGVAFQPHPFRLAVEDRERAMTPFLPESEVPRPLGDLFNSVLQQLRRREQGSGFDSDELNRLITDVGPAAIRGIIPEAGKVSGSTGIGSQSDVPWIAVFPDAGAASAQAGFYLVYLFAKDGSSAYLSLNQGTEHVRGGRQALLKRSLDLRSVIGNRADDALNLSIDLRSNNARPRRYEAGSALAYSYRPGDMPDDHQLATELRTLYDLLLIVVGEGVQFHPEIEPIHLLLKWNRDRRQSTIDDHKSIAEAQGSVWWGRITGPGVSAVSAEKLADLRLQLTAGLPTHAYLYRREELWRATVVEVTDNQSEVTGDARFPHYYSASECNFFVRVTDFCQLPRDWAREHLVLASDPNPLKLEGALSNQTSPLFVFERFDPAEPPGLPRAPKTSGEESDTAVPEPTVGPRVWIFQANPKMFDLIGYLGRPSTKPGSVDSWLLRQYADQVRDGDTVLLWTAGDAAGIYATGTILGESFTRPREEWEGPDSPEASLAIRYRLEHLLLDKPVLRSELLQHPLLKDLLILRRPAGTNFPVNEDQWLALRPLIEPTSGIAPEPASPPDPSIDLDWLLRETLWGSDEIEDIVDTLHARRPQVILAGPPGTGKTWVAERIGLYLAGGRRDAVHVVQFHPSYAYEDFVEGLRPVAPEGQVVFEVVPGALVKIADQARKVDHPVALVIDEINRANLPSVFGELLYLLEYRGKEIRLLHRDSFSLPPNLYVIGTMNTADRSIRSVDTALRRRFDIFECPPRRDILDAWYGRGGNNCEVLGLGEGLRKLNEMLTRHIDHHHTVGHSFFMGKTFTQNDLRRTWHRQIRPLIDEYFFDQPDLVQEFDLKTFWPSYPSP